jgi:hypothetical protein
MTVRRLTKMCRATGEERCARTREERNAPAGRERGRKGGRSKSRARSRSPGYDGTNFFCTLFMEVCGQWARRPHQLVGGEELCIYAMAAMRPYAI